MNKPEDEIMLEAEENNPETTENSSPDAEQTKTPESANPESEAEREENPASEQESNPKSNENETTEEKSTENNLQKELEGLKAELARLSEALEKQKAFYLRINGEVSEFCELYEGVSLKTLPDGVWEMVEDGVPLSAAYALVMRREEISHKKAEAVNAQNTESASGGLGRGKDDGCFSVDEVRAMSAAEVRKNYEKIIKSAKHW